MRGYGRPGPGDYGARFGLGPAVFTFLVINLAVFLLGMVMRTLSGSDPLYQIGAYNTRLAVYSGQIWRFFTYMFLHGGFYHILFNMLGLWLFGSRLEAIWGSRTFTWYYLASGVGGGLLYGILTVAGVQADGAMVGASGAIYGILLAFGLAFPDAVIFVFFIPMPARIAVVVLGLMALFGVGGAGVAHMAHLGGMITGFLFLWLFTGGRPSQVPRLPGGRRRPTTYSSGPGGTRTATGGGSFLTALRNSLVRWRTRMRMTVVDSQNRKRSGSSGTSSGGNGRPVSGAEAQRVDEILEKISREGLQSLTEEEQDILRRASRRH